MPVGNNHFDLSVVVCGVIKEEQMVLVKLFQQTASSMMLNNHLKVQLGLHRKIASLGMAARTIIHDLNNPLNALSATLQLLAFQAADNSALKKLVNRANIACQDITALVKNISEYASKGASLKLSKEKLSDIICIVVEMWQDEIRRQHIELTVDIQDDQELMTDKLKLMRVLNNLISNAVDAMAVAEHKELHICLFRNQKYYILMVSDSGGGIPEEFRHKIYQPFQTVDKCKGFGLGLTIVKELVHMLDADICCETSNLGTDFYIFMPLKDSAQPFQRHKDIRSCPGLK